MKNMKNFEMYADSKKEANMKEEIKIEHESKMIERLKYSTFVSKDLRQANSKD